MSYSLETSYATPQTGLFSHFHQKGSQLDDILNRPDAKLEELLDYDDFLYELKNSNPRLLDYFSQNTDKVKLLLDYVIKVHPDINDTKKSYNYPLLVNEVFEADIPAIMNAFFVSKQPAGLEPSPNGLKQSFIASSTSKPDGNDLLSYLFSFLNTKGDLNPVLAGYFNKLVQKLLKKNQRRTVEFVLSDSRILPQLVEHIGNSSIAEIIPPFFIYENYLFDENKPEYLRVKIESVNKILSTLNNINEPEEMSNVAEILGELIKRNETMADGKDILNLILSKETTDRLFSILSRSSANTVVVQICHVIMTFLAYYILKTSGPHSPIMSPYQQSGIPDNPLFLAICDNFHVFTKLLAEEKSEILPNTFGQSAKPLGRGKLKVAEVIEKIVRIDNKKLFRKINESGVLKALTDMVARYLWNNMLHTTFEKIVFTILEKRDSFLVEALLDKSNFIQFIVREIKDEQFNLPKNAKKIRKGNIGHIIKLANELERVASLEASIEAYVKRVHEWETVVLPILKTRNEMDNVEMGGENPKTILIALGLMDPPATTNEPAPNKTYSMRDSLQFTSTQADQQQIPGGFMHYLPENSPHPEKNKASFSDFVLDPKQIPASSPQNFSYASDPFNASPIGQLKTRDSFTGAASPYTGYAAVQEVQQDPRPAPGLQPGSYQTDIKPFSYSSYDLKPTTEPENKSSYLYDPTKPHLSFGEQDKSSDISKPYHNHNSHHNDGTRLVKKPSNEEPLPKVESPFDKLYLSVHARSKSDQTEAHKIIHHSHEAEDLFDLRARKSDFHTPSFISPPVDRPLRNSMIEMSSGSKIKLTTQSSERLDGGKILDMFNRYTGPSPSSSYEFRFANNSQSESDNLTEEPFYPRLPEISHFSLPNSYAYKKPEVFTDKGYY